MGNCIRRPAKPMGGGVLPANTYPVRVVVEERNSLKGGAKGFIQITDTFLIFTSQKDSRKKMMWSLKHLQKYGHEGCIFCIVAAGPTYYAFKTEHAQQLSEAFAKANASLSPLRHTASNKPNLESLNSQNQQQASPGPVKKRQLNYLPIVLEEPSSFTFVSNPNSPPNGVKTAYKNMEFINVDIHMHHKSSPTSTVSTSLNNNESGSDSESKDNADSDSEDDVVTCLQEPAPIEGTNNLPPFPNGRGVMQLWHFLLDMLLTPDKNYMIQWTGNKYEFTILQPDDIAALWGERKGKPRMNYDKISRVFHYYYSKGIMDKVPGKKLTFKFTCNVENYVRTRSSNPNAVQTLKAIIRNSK